VYGYGRVWYHGCPDAGAVVPTHTPPNTDTLSRTTTNRHPPLNPPTKARNLPYILVPFDQGEDLSYVPALVCIWATRVVAVGFFVMTIMVDFEIGGAKAKDEDNSVGEGGYLHWHKNSDSTALALALLPSIFLSCWSIFQTYLFLRYGNKDTLSLSYNRRWNAPLPGALFYAVRFVYLPE